MNGIMEQLMRYKAPYELTKNKGDQGWDIRASREYTLYPGERELVSTSLYLELPDGIYADVRPRSGLSAEGIDVCLGLVDSSYRGEVKVCMVNNTNEKFIVNKGDRIAQLVFGKEVLVETIKADEIDTDTGRGDKGFGSSGKD